MVVFISTGIAFAAIIATIPVGDQPESMAFYPAKNTHYSVNHTPNTVSVVDASTNTEITQITIGNSPVDVAVYPARDRVYVANGGSNTVSVINASSNLVIATISISDSPRGLAVDSERDVVYVTLRNAGNVTIVDAATNTVTTSISVGAAASRPIAAAVNLDTDKLYVLKRGTIGQSVAVIDVTTNTLSSTIILNNNQFLRDIVVDSTTNTVYVTNDLSSGSNPSDQLFVIDGATDALIQIIGMNTAPKEMFFDAITQRLFVSETGAGTVTVIDTTTNTKISECAVGNSPRGLALNSGLLYVNNRNTDEVLVIDECPTILAVGGTSLPINTTSLLLTGATIHVWMIPVVLAGIGIGIFVIKRRN